MQIVQSDGAYSGFRIREVQRKSASLQPYPASLVTTVRWQPVLDKVLRPSFSQACHA
jgi:hypothetical protein